MKVIKKNSSLIKENFVPNPKKVAAEVTLTKSEVELNSLSAAE